MTIVGLLSLPDLAAVGGDSQKKDYAKQFGFRFGFTRCATSRNRNRYPNRNRQTIAIVMYRIL